ncbi:MAG: 16S rRNA (cytosine(1402)-N(4))-methyltransferase RsmH [Kofleriaceae bacterium]
MGEPAAFAHVSVLLEEALRLLAPRTGGTYCDGTLGGAGHARAVAERIAPGGHLIGVDRDPMALRAAEVTLADAAVQVTLVHGSFGDLAAHLAERGIGAVDGILLDLGVSSPQLDLAERGFSFTHAGPIDMRMDPTRGPTARELIDFLDEGALAEVLRDLGEERFHRKIARAIKAAAAAGGLDTTVALARVVTEAMPPRERATSKIHPATRTFQALRLAVNRELDELDRFLADLPALLAPGGRCVVISFHSLEDRRVKHRMRDLAWSSSLPPRYAAAAGERAEPVCELLTRKAVIASDEERARNPRARSAKLRACARTAAPNLPMRGNPAPPSPAP